MAPIHADIHQHDALPFPRSLPEFQRLFPDDAACAAYLEKIRWDKGFVCPHCGAALHRRRHARSQHAGVAMTQPNDQAVEAAARARWERDRAKQINKSWEDLHEWNRGYRLFNARADLEAALPHLTQSAPAAETGGWQALRELGIGLIQNNDDTVWFGPAETAVDFIFARLGLSTGDGHTETLLAKLKGGRPAPPGSPTTPEPVSAEMEPLWAQLTAATAEIKSMQHALGEIAYVLDSAATFLARQEKGE